MNTEVVFPMLSGDQGPKLTFLPPSHRAGNYEKLLALLSIYRPCTNVLINGTSALQKLVFLSENCALFIMV